MHGYNNRYDEMNNYSQYANIVFEIWYQNRTEQNRMEEHDNMFWIQDHQIHIAKTAVMKTCMDIFRDMMK